MNLKEQIAQDMQGLLQNNSLSETLSINETVNVVGLVAYEASPQKGNELSGEGWSTRATIFIAASEIDKPQRGDTVTDSKGNIWRVISIMETPGMYQLYCVSDESPWG